MIRRDAGDSWLLITQVDHAHLAADLADAWGNAQVPALPEAALLRAAIRDHDEGWRLWEASPRVDPERRVPRQFLEMPMTEATTIWRRSVEICRRRERATADAMAAFEQYLATQSKRLTPDRIAIARTALSLPGSFDAAGVAAALQEGQRAAREKASSGLTTVYRVLQWLSAARLLVRNPQIRDRRVFRNSGTPLGPSPWPGLWVSRHFSFLAEQALTHRVRQDADRSDADRHDADRRALEWFLDEQRRLQSEWRTETRRAGGDSNEIGDSPVGDDTAHATRGAAANDRRDDTARLEAEGFRWLQFFDRLSLWLCRGQGEATEPIARPCDTAVHFTPLKSGEIAVEPYPFGSERLEVSVTARRIEAIPLQDDADLAARLAEATPVELRWELVRW